jgi:hypothetical protein
MQTLGLLGATAASFGAGIANPLLWYVSRYIAGHNIEHSDLCIIPVPVAVWHIFSSRHFDKSHSSFEQKRERFRVPESM